MEVLILALIILNGFWTVVSIFYGVWAIILSKKYDDNFLSIGYFLLFLALIFIIIILLFIER